MLLITTFTCLFALFCLAGFRRVRYSWSQSNLAQYFGEPLLLLLCARHDRESTNCQVAGAFPTPIG